MRAAVLAAAILCLGLAGDVRAQSICHWGADLSGEEVVPPTGSSGSGSVYAVFADQAFGFCCGEEGTDSLEVRVGYSNLSGQPTGAYVHQGVGGSNGDRLYVLFDDVFESDSVVRIPISPEHCYLMDAFGLYVVVTTEQFAEGEIRGQLHLLPTPVETPTWGRIRAGYQD